MNLFVIIKIPAVSGVETLQFAYNIGTSTIPNYVALDLMNTANNPSWIEYAADDHTLKIPAESTV